MKKDLDENILKNVSGGEAVTERKMKCSFCQKEINSLDSYTNGSQKFICEDCYKNNIPDQDKHHWYKLRDVLKL